MRVLFAGIVAVILVIAGSQPASAQVVGGKFIGVDDDPAIGDANAKVTIIEFGDYQCPSCRMFWREVEPRLKKDYINTGKVRMVFRDFPIVQIHPESIMAAMAADCANDQGKYWQYHDKGLRRAGQERRRPCPLQGHRPEEVGQGHRPRPRQVQRVRRFEPLQRRSPQGQGGWRRRRHPGHADVLHQRARYRRRAAVSRVQEADRRVVEIKKAGLTRPALHVTAMP